MSIFAFKLVSDIITSIKEPYNLFEREKVKDGDQTRTRSSD